MGFDITIPYLYFMLKQMRIWFYRVLSSSWKSVSSSSLWNGSRNPFLCILFLMTAQPNAKPSRVPSTKQPTEMPATVPAMSSVCSSISPVLKRLCRIQFHSVASSVLFVDKSSAVQITVPEKDPRISLYTRKCWSQQKCSLHLSDTLFRIIFVTNLYWSNIFENSYSFRPTHFTITNCKSCITNCSWLSIEYIHSNRKYCMIEIITMLRISKTWSQITLTFLPQHSLLQLLDNKILFIQEVIFSKPIKFFNISTKLALLKIKETECEEVQKKLYYNVKFVIF